MKKIIVLVMSIYLCNTLTGSFTGDVCTLIPGQIRSFSLIQGDIYDGWSDFTSALEWNNNIASGEVVVINNAEGSKNEGSPSYVDAPGDAYRILANVEHTGTLALWGLTSDNRDFLNSLNKTSSYHGAFRVGTLDGTPVHLISTAPVNWFFDIPVDGSKDSIVKFTGTFAWKDQNISLVKSVPSGIYA